MYIPTDIVYTIFFATYYILVLPGSMTHSDDKWPKKSNSYVVGVFLFSMENRFVSDILIKGFLSILNKLLEK